MERNIFIESLKLSLKELEFDYEKTQMITHKGMKGQVREYALAHILRKFMPIRYSFSTGEIYDFNNNVSKQQDIIIYDNIYSLNIPIEENIYQVYKDCVYGTIEIKSILNSTTLDESLNNIISVKSMKKTTSDEIHINPLFTIKFEKIPITQNSVSETVNCIFAYKSELSIDNILQKLEEKSKTTDYMLLPNFIVLLDKRIIIHRLKKRDDGLVEIKTLGDYDYFGFLEYDDDLLATFILQLYCELSRVKVLAEDFVKLKNNIQSFYISNKLTNNKITTIKVNKKV